MKPMNMEFDDVDAARAIMGKILRKLQFSMLWDALQVWRRRARAMGRMRVRNLAMEAFRNSSEGSRTKVEVERIMDFFREYHHSLYECIDKDRTAEFVQALCLTEVKERTLLFEQGSLGARLYIVIEGSVPIYVYDAANGASTKVERSRRHSIKDDSLKAKRPDLLGKQVAIMRAPSVFGEIALNSSPPVRMASALALAGTVLLTVPKQIYTEILSVRRQQDRELDENVAFLRTVPAFSTWTHSRRLHFLFSRLIRKDAGA